MNTEDAGKIDDAKPGGIILIATSLLAMLMIAHHPQSTTHESSKLIAEIADLAWIDRVVHGSLIALLAVQAYCYSGVCIRLGVWRGLVRAGAVAYAIGIFAIVVAAMIDGFVVPGVAAHYAPGRAEDLEAAHHLLNLCGISVGLFTSLAVVTMSAATIAWSIALMRVRANAWLGVCGLLLGAGPALALLFGVITMSLHGVIVFLLCQTIWNLAVGVMLIRGKI